MRPTSPRAKADRRDRGPKREKRQGESKRGPRKERSPERAPRAEREPKTNATPIDPTTVSAAATTFLEGLLVASDIRGSVSATVSVEDIDINVDGDGVSMYVGAKGATLMALQDLTRVVSQRRLGDHDTRLRIDVGGYRERRREALGRFAMKVAQDVMESGTPRILEPMNSADRKIVHDTLATVAEVVTHSEGDDPFRRVVVSAAPSATGAHNGESRGDADDSDTDL